VDSQFPDLDTLSLGLASVFREGGVTDGEVIVLDRQPNPLARTFPTEIIRCRLGDGRELLLFCKYEAGRSHNAYGHRGGIAYEAEVYRSVLRPLEVTHPRFYGSYVDPATNDMWLILEHLEKVNSNPTGGEKLSPEDKRAYWCNRMGLAARWIGRFHALCTAMHSIASVPFLNTYDTEYYLGWARRAEMFAGELHKEYPWLTVACRHYGELVELLLSAPQVIVHGEYYKHNYLFRHGTIYPVDWESAAIGAGEIDLASLTERWPSEIVRHCELQYQQERWPEGSPTDFMQRLDAARLYLQFRWLGDQPDWTMGKHKWRFEYMRSLSPSYQ